MKKIFKDPPMKRGLDHRPKPGGKPPKPTPPPPRTYKTAIKEREIWFEELLEIYLPGTLEKLIKTGRIKI